MYDIHHLEEEWKRYDRKKKQPWVITFIFLFIVCAGIFLFSKDPTFLEFFKDQNSTAAVDQKHTEKVLDIYFDTALKEVETKDATIQVDTPMEVVKHPLEESEIPSAPIHEEKKSKIHIEVVDGNNKNVYKEVEKRFRLGHDIDDSLFLAKAYYLRGEYKKAEYWALQTNKIKDNIEESWLIFIKSKIKTGHKNEAIRILNTYIQKTNSREAKVLLQKIRK